MAKKKPRNISIPYKVVEDFLKVEQQSTKYTSQQHANIVRNLMNALKESYQHVQQGYSDPHLTVCVAKLGYLDPEEVKRYLAKEIPAVTIRPRKKGKTGRNMGVYIKHTPQFYLMNPPSEKTK